MLENRQSPNKKTELNLRHWADSQRGSHLLIAECETNILSVFDDLRYDRSDADMVSPAMRNHLVKKLSSIGFKQVSGNVVEHKLADVRCIIPKNHALGSSPFDIARYTKKRPQDFYVLTATQTACQIVDLYPLEEAVNRICSLIKQQPININRLFDYLDQSSRHKKFIQVIGHLKYVQRVAIETEPLRGIRPLG